MDHDADVMLLGLDVSRRLGWRGRRSSRLRSTRSKPPTSTLRPRRSCKSLTR